MADGGPAALVGAAEALDANFGELLAWYASWPGGEVRRDAELQLASTGVRFRAINTAALSDLAPATATNRIADAVAWLSARTDRWRWLVTSVVPRFRRIDADTCLVSASLRRISDESRHLASAPCVLPQAAVSRRP